MNAVDEYIRLADAWERSMEEGDSDTANTLHDRLLEVFQSISRKKQEDALFDRADTTNDAACFFIASHLKERDARRALGLYERLIRSPHPFIVMSAKHIVKEMAGPEG